MTSPTVDWQAAFEVWLAPFLARLGRVEQRRWAPVYLQGLLGPGERKSVEPMAARVAPGVFSRCITSSPPRPGGVSHLRKSWCGLPTGWWVGRTPCWSSATLRW